MYDSYFGLRGQPFRLTPDTSFFFGEGQRKAILDALVYALKNGDGIIKLIGEVGTGKTFLSRMLEKALPDNFEFIFILNPNMPAENVLLAIARELGLGLPYLADKLAVLHALQARLLSLHAENRQVVVVIDEAQSMPPETLEEIRLLSNLETESHKLLQILLIGQPELDQRLNRHNIRQIKERITHSLYLPSMNQREIYRYIDYRLRCAGYQGVPLFSRCSASLIALKSRGLLRRVNILADKALLTAFSKGSHFVGFSDALKSITDGSSATMGMARWSKVLAISAVAFLCVFAATKPWNAIDIPALFSGQQLPVYRQVRETAMDTDVKVPRQSVRIQGASSGQTLLESRILETRTWIAQSSQLGYSIQLLQSFTDQPQSLEKFIAKVVPRNLINETYVFPTQVEGKTLWSVFLGRFESYQNAAQMLQGLDSHLKQNQPFVVKMSHIKDLYNQPES